MYRVLLRVLKVFIHIKERLGLTITLKKDHVFFGSTKIFNLIDGKAEVHENYQLLVIQSDPTFQIQINILYNNMKKLVGFTQVNLEKWILNQTNHQVGILQKSPGAKAQIDYQFVYYQTNIPFKGQKILMYCSSANQSKQQKTNRQKMQLQNLNLLTKNQQLNRQKQRLQIQKQKFSNEKVSLNESFLKEAFQLDTEQLKMKNENVYISQELAKQQEKRNFLIQLIQNSGEETLMNQFKSFRAQYDTQNYGVFSTKYCSKFEDQK